MAESDEDVPPLEDMTDLLQQVDALRDRSALDSSKTQIPTEMPNTVVSNQTKQSPQSANKLSLSQNKVIPEVSENKKCDRKENTTFGGMKKGFLFGGPKSVSVGSGTKKSEDLPLIKPRQTDARENELKLPEVQAKMDSAQAMLHNKDQWLTEDLLQKVAANPNLMKGMADPNFMQAITEFQTNPRAAMQTYADNPEVTKFLKDFAGIMGSHFTKVGEEQDKKSAKQNSPEVLLQTKEGADISVRSSSDPKQPTAEDERKIQKLLQTPEIRDILQDPKVQLLIETLRTDPDKAQRVLSMRDANLQYKIKRLVDVGLLQFQR